MLPRFTENGFKVVETPPDVQAKLKAAVDKALATGQGLRDEDPTLSSYRYFVIHFGGIVQSRCAKQRCLAAVPRR